MTTVAAKPAASGAQECGHRLTTLEDVAALSLDALFAGGPRPRGGRPGAGIPVADRKRVFQPYCRLAR